MSAFGEAGAEFPGESYEMKIAMREREFSQPSRQLFVGNISANVRVTDIQNLFRGFGEIESLKEFVARGYVFIIYKRVEDAVRARETMSKNCPVLSGRPLVVNYGRPAPASAGGEASPSAAPSPVSDASAATPREASAAERPPKAQEPESQPQPQQQR
jgi:RNA recognition motif-containing protein